LGGYSPGLENKNPGVDVDVFVFVVVFFVVVVAPIVGYKAWCVIEECNFRGWITF
jgi:hypothetical protein